MNKLNMKSYDTPKKNKNIIKVDLSEIDNLNERIEDRIKSNRLSQDLKKDLIL